GTVCDDVFDVWGYEYYWQYYNCASGTCTDGWDSWFPFRFNLFPLIRRSANAPHWQGLYQRLSSLWERSSERAFGIIWVTQRTLVVANLRALPEFTCTVIHNASLKPERNSSFARPAILTAAAMAKLWFQGTRHTASAIVTVCAPYVS